MQTYEKKKKRCVHIQTSSTKYTAKMYITLDDRYFTIITMSEVKLIQLEDTFRDYLKHT